MRNGGVLALARDCGTDPGARPVPEAK